MAMAGPSLLNTARFQQCSSLWCLHRGCGASGQVSDLSLPVPSVPVPTLVLRLWLPVVLCDPGCVSTSRTFGTIKIFELNPSRQIWLVVFSTEGPELPATAPLTILGSPILGNPQGAWEPFLDHSLSPAPAGTVMVSAGTWWWAHWPGLHPGSLSLALSSQPVVLACRASLGHRACCRPLPRTTSSLSSG